MRKQKECPKCGATAVLEDADYDPAEDRFYRVFQCPNDHTHYEYFNGDQTEKEDQAENEDGESDEHGEERSPQDRLKATREMNALLDRLGVEPR